MSHELRLLLAVGLLLPAACTADQSDVPVAAKSVFVDVETKQPVVQEASAEVPAVNASTGRRTLMPGLYCTQCKAWRPSPPLEVAQRTPAALRCPQCRGPMTADGPRPE